MCSRRSTLAGLPNLLSTANTSDTGSASSAGGGCPGALPARRESSSASSAASSASLGWNQCRPAKALTAKVARLRPLSEHWGSCCCRSWVRRGSSGLSCRRRCAAVDRLALSGCASTSASCKQGLAQKAYCCVDEQSRASNPCSCDRPLTCVQTCTAPDRSAQGRDLCHLPEPSSFEGRKAAFYQRAPSRSPPTPSASAARSTTLLAQ